MKRKITFAIIGILFLNYAQSQIKYGIKAGASIANWQGDAVKSMGNFVDLTNGFISTKSRTGLHIGGYLNIPVSGYVSIEPGLQYSQKGYTMVGDLKIDALKFLGANASAKVQADYIDIPLVIRANVSKGLSVFAGPQVSFLVKNNLKLDAGVLGFSLFSRNLDITNNFNTTDIAVTGGVGYQFDNGFNINAGYDYGLSKVDKNSNFKAYNRVIKVSVGFSF